MKLECFVATGFRLSKWIALSAFHAESMRRVYLWNFWVWLCIAAKFVVLESYSSYANVKLCGAVRAWLVLSNWHPKTAAKKNKHSKYSKNNYPPRKTWTNLNSLIAAESRFGPVNHALIAESRFGPVNHASIAQSHFWSNHVLIAEFRVEPVNHTLIAGSRF